VTEASGRGRSVNLRNESGVRWILPWLLATWFVVITVMRMVVIGPGGPGFDGRLYRAATIEWLHGGDPWAVVQGGVYFGAPPPSLIPMIPFALLPEPIAIGLLLGLGVAGTAWAIRRLGMPLWWLAFPPLVDGLWNANPHVLVLPLLLAGLAPIAIIVKVYAAIVPAIRLEVRALALAAILLVATVPFVPWDTYLAERQTIQDHLDRTSGGGLSAWSFDLPLLAVIVLVTVTALLVLARRDRDRAAWLAMPALWPWTQWYYSSLAIPGLSDREGPNGPLASIETTVAAAGAAAILAVPLEGGPVIALVILAVAPPLLHRLHTGALARRDAQPHGTLPTPHP
jgi:hypothetical protein